MAFEGVNRSTSSSYSIYKANQLGYKHVQNFVALYESSIGDDLILSRPSLSYQLSYVFRSFVDLFLNCSFAKAVLSAVQLLIPSPL